MEPWILEKTNENNETIIGYIAIKCGHLNIVKYVAEESRSFLHWATAEKAAKIASEHGHLSITFYIIQKTGIKFYSMDESKSHVLHQAFKIPIKDEKILKSILQIYLDTGFNCGWEIIDIALEQSNLDIIRYIAANVPSFLAMKHWLTNDTILHKAAELNMTDADC